jgi:anaerobic magnesium-protoporphyrin IX monomethyl ester cyclase
MAELVPDIRGHLQRGNHRILLVNPPYYRLYNDKGAWNNYPLSLGYLAGSIKENSDWDVMIYNADFTTGSEPWTIRYFLEEGFENYRKNLADFSCKVWEEVSTTIRDYDPSVLGIYCCASNSRTVAMTAKLAKEYNEKIVVLVGGPHPTAVGAGALTDHIDVAVAGEGEHTIIDLLRPIDHRAPIVGTKGTICRAGEGIARAPARELIENLDSLPFPQKYAKEALKEYDMYPKSAFGGVIATRGCPYDCFFCGSQSMWGGRVRYRSVENVTEEVKSLQDAGLRWMKFWDDTFTLNREYTRNLCASLIENCAKMHWTCETRLDRLDEDLLLLMKKAGCMEITVGIESGNDQVLKHMRKGITIEEAIQKATLIRKNGIRLSANFLVGTPWETERSMHDTLAAMRKIDGKLGYSVFTPYPGTEAFKYCENAGLLQPDYDASLYNHQSPENHFYVDLDKKRFREIASEIEEFVDNRNRTERVKDLLSSRGIYELLNHGGFRDVESFVRTIRAILAQPKWILDS